MRRRQVADDPTHRPAQGASGHHDGSHPGDGPWSRRGGAADARRREETALDLPIDGTFPFVHPEREFMHLAYLIYDVGFQSPNSQAAKPMVFTITFLLVTIIALLNVAAIWIRSRLKRRYVSQQF
jgi:hypothetical protein